MLFELKEPKDSWECLEYSPDSKFLAVWSYDKNIYIYKCGKKVYRLHKTLEKHPGGVFTLDWDISGDYIRSNCTNDEITYWDIENSKKISNLKEVKDLQWESNNWKLTWETKAVFPHGYRPDYINCWCIGNKGKLIATGDDDAIVRIHPTCCLKAHSSEITDECAKYLLDKNPPCMRNKEFVDKYRAHAGYIGRICFDHEGRYLFSLGGNDKTLIQWKSVRD